MREFVKAESPAASEADASYAPDFNEDLETVVTAAAAQSTPANSVPRRHPFDLSLLSLDEDVVDLSPTQDEEADRPSLPSFESNANLQSRRQGGSISVVSDGNLPRTTSLPAVELNLSAVLKPSLAVGGGGNIDLSLFSLEEEVINKALVLRTYTVH